MKRFLVLLLLAGCSTTEWVRPDSNAEETDRDIVDCTRQAQREADLRAGGFYGPTYGPYYGRYGAIGSPGPLYNPTGNRALDEAALRDYCMRSKGYQQVPRQR